MLYIIKNSFTLVIDNVIAFIWQIVNPLSIKLSDFDAKKHSVVDLTSSDLNYFPLNVTISGHSVQTNIFIYELKSKLA